MTRVWLVLLGLVAVARGEQPADTDLRRLFPQQAPVFVAPPGGLSRLRVPPGVLAACRPDLADVRLFDAQGAEVPYVIDGGPEARTRTEVTETVEATILDVRREEIRREQSPSRYRERYTVALPDTAPRTGSWSLAFKTDRPRFVRRVDVTATAADGTSNRIVEDGSLFRLPNAKEKTRLALPALTDEHLTITLEGEDGFYLEPRIVFENARFIDPRDEVAVPLEELAREQRDGRTVVELARPRGLVPDVLRVETTTALFDRGVEVWDERTGAEAVLLGRASVFRLEAITTVGESELALAPARGERLRVEIADGDSAPLDGLAFSVVVRQPSLVFSLASVSAEDPAATLLFGGGRAYAPRCDLASLGERATAAARLRDPGATLTARLGSIEANPRFDGAPVLAFAMQPGAEVDTRLYMHRRSLTVRPSSEGLSRLVMRPVDVAHARADLADVRVVDPAARQWPYLLEMDGAKEWQQLDVGAPARRDRTSRYRLGLPSAPVRIDQLVLDTDARFFDRSFRVLATTDDQREATLAQGRLVRRLGKPHPVTIAFSPARVDSVDLVVSDGDDAPLRFRAARARVVLPELYLAAPAGDYFLLVGEPNATPPSYELARVRDVVLAVSAAPVELKEPGPNPDFSAGARLVTAGSRGDLVPHVVLWAVLVGAVVVLTVMTLRLARSGGDAPPP